MKLDADQDWKKNSAVECEDMVRNADLTAGRVVLKPGRERSVLNRHPWIFSGAIAHLPEAADGSIVTVVSAGGDVLGGGYYSSKTSISVR